MVRRIAALVGLLLIAVGGLAAAGVHPAFGGKPETVTLCHAAGREGTTQFVTLTIPYNAAFGQAGHFNEDGTPNAGHEQDYLGPCTTDTTTTTTTDTTTTTETTTETTTTETTTTTQTETQPPPRCPPGQGPYQGKDGEPGNQECCPDANGDQRCDVPPPDTTTTVTTTPPPTTTTPPPTAPTPTVGEETEPPKSAVSENPPIVTFKQPKPKKKPPKMPPVCSPAGIETEPCAVAGQG